MKMPKGTGLAGALMPSACPLEMEAMAQGPGGKPALDFIPSVHCVPQWPDRTCRSQGMKVQELEGTA